MERQTYARKEFRFTPRQKPGKGTHWAKELEGIEKYPFHTNSSSFILFAANPVSCNCGYHMSIHNYNL